MLYLSFKHNSFRYFRHKNTLFQGNEHPFATLFQGNEVCRWGYKALAIGGERVKKSGRQGTTGGGARSAPGLGRGGARNGSADTNAGIWP